MRGGMFLLALSVLAHAEPGPPALPSSTQKERSVSLIVGAGASKLVGGNGAGFGAGLAERFALDVALGRAGGIYLNVDHAHHGMKDAGAWFPEVEVDPGLVTGARDYFAVDLGGRLALRMGDPTAAPTGVRAWPVFRFGAGALFTDTRLEVPAFTGREPVHTRLASPLLTMGAGAEVVLVDWLSLIPNASVQITGAQDPGEVDDETEVGVEIRGQLGLDLGFNF